MLCRQLKRKEYVSKILNIAEKEDKLLWFKEPYEMDEYKRIIKNPMYFTKMRENMSKYVTDIGLMKEHFNLIFTNAYNYNKPKDKAYRDAERVQEIINKTLDRKWDKFIEKQEMTMEEREHQTWVKEQIEKDPDFLDKSEDVIVPERKYQYIPHKAKQDNEEMAEFINDTRSYNKKQYMANEHEKAQSSNVSVDQSGDDNSIAGVKLRQRRQNIRYIDDELLSLQHADSKNSKGKPVEETKLLSKKSSVSGKQRKNPEVHFSSDEDIEVVKKLPLENIDLNAKNYTAKHLLEHPEELEDMDLKQYYHNPVRCCFDDPILAFVPLCFLCGAFGNEDEFIFCNLCGESFHPFCEKFKIEDRDKIQEYWK